MPTSQGIEGYRESTSAVMMWVPGGSVPVGRLLRNDVVSLEEPGILSSSGHVIEVSKLSIRYKGLLYVATMGLPGKVPEVGLIDLWILGRKYMGEADA